MAKSKKKTPKTVNVTASDAGFALAGAVGGLLINKALDYAAEELLEVDADQMKTLNMGVQTAKVAGGGYAAYHAKTPRHFKFMGLGIAAEGAVELAIAVSDGQLAMGVAGTDGSHYNVGSAGSGTIIDIPIDMSEVAGAGDYDDVEDMESL